MTRKDYIDIANILRNTDMPDDVRRVLSREFSDLFKSDNANFDRDRFRLAVSK